LFCATEVDNRVQISVTVHLQYSPLRNVTSSCRVWWRCPSA